jgi:hypothetical protein
VSAVPSFTHVGVQVADGDTVDAIRLHTGGAGLILGTGQNSELVMVSLFRPEPTVAAVIGGVGLAQIVAFRALALGAALVIKTGRPSAWSALAQAAADTRGAVEVVWPDRQPGWYGSSLRPQLLLVDGYSTAELGPMPTVQGWSTLITVREQVANRDAYMLGRADVILSHRLSVQESELVCAAVNKPDLVSALAALPDRTVAVIGRADIRVARMTKTEIEVQMLGRQSGHELPSLAQHDRVLTHRADLGAGRPGPVDAAVDPF